MKRGFGVLSQTLKCCTENKNVRTSVSRCKITSAKLTVSVWDKDIIKHCQLPSVQPGGEFNYIWSSEPVLITDCWY